MDCPEVNRSGEVFIGSLPYQAWNGNITGAQLKDQASATISAKETNRYSSTIRISNRNLISGGSGATFMGNEPVGYMYFYNYARNITTGNLSEYTIEVKGKINYAWIPDGQRPLLTGLVSPPVMSNRPESQQEQVVARSLGSMNMTCNSASGKILNWVSSFAKGLKSAIPMIEGVSNVAKAFAYGTQTIASLLMDVSPIRAVDWTDSIAWLDLIEGKIYRYFPEEHLTPMISGLLTSFEDALETLKEGLYDQTSLTRKWWQFLKPLERRHHVKRGRASYTYEYLGENLSESELWGVFALANQIPAEKCIANANDCSVVFIEEDEACKSLDAPITSRSTSQPKTDAQVQSAHFAKRK